MSAKNRHILMPVYGINVSFKVSFVELLNTFDLSGKRVCTTKIAKFIEFSAEVPKILEKS